MFRPSSEAQLQAGAVISRRERSWQAAGYKWTIIAPPTGLLFCVLLANQKLSLFYPALSPLPPPPTPSSYAQPTSISLQWVLLLSSFHRLLQARIYLIQGYFSTFNIPCTFVALGLCIIMRGDLTGVDAVIQCTHDQGLIWLSKRRTLYIQLFPYSMT